MTLNKSPEQETEQIKRKTNKNANQLVKDQTKLRSIYTEGSNQRRTTANSDHLTPVENQTRADRLEQKSQKPKQKGEATPESITYTQKHKHS